jgi:hypothetical protein
MRTRSFAMTVGVSAGLSVLLACASVGRAELRLSAETVGWTESSPLLYARVDVVNRYGRKMTYRLVIRDPFSKQRTVVGNQSLGPGQSRVYHLPIMQSGWRHWQVETIDELGGTVVSGLSVEERQFLHVCPLREWANQAELEDFSNRYVASGRTYSSSSNRVSQVEVTALPDNWQCYTPFTAVFMDDRLWPPTEPAQGKALVQWVQAGGRLVIYGGSQEARTIPTMLGTIEYMDTHPIKSDSRESQRVSGARGWQSASRTLRAGDSIPFVVRQWAGRFGGLSLATLFFVVAGPLNYWYFARRGRIRALLVSLPLASIACCLLITGYFLVSQGFAKRGGSLAVIVLDEESDSAITFCRHVFFSGLYPLGGFSFARDAAFRPMVPDDRSRSFLMDLTDGQRLRSGFFSPSTNFHYFTVRPWTTRAKLVWDLDELTVINGFDADAARVLLRVGGALYEARDVAKGGKAKLAPAGLAGSAGLAEKILAANEPREAYLLRHMGDLLRAFPADSETPCYMVVFKKPPVDLNAGLTMRGGNQYCVLVGKSMLGAPAAGP